MAGVAPEKRYEVINHSGDAQYQAHRKQLCLPVHLVGRPTLKSGESTVLKGRDLSESMLKMAKKFKNGEAGSWLEIREYKLRSAKTEEKPALVLANDSEEKTEETVSDHQFSPEDNDLKIENVSKEEELESKETSGETELSEEVTSEDSEASSEEGLASAESLSGFDDEEDEDIPASDEEETFSEPKITKKGRKKKSE